MRTNESYTYQPLAESDELVGELLTDVVTKNALTGIDVSDKEQIEEVAQLINEFGAGKGVKEEPLELARLVVANSIKGWLPTGSGGLYADWQRVHSGYAGLNNGSTTPAVLLKVRERYDDDRKPYGYFMSSGSDALMLDHIKIKKSSMFRPTLQSEYEGYGKLFTGHGRNIPHAQSRGLQKEQFMHMLLQSGHIEQPVSSEEHDEWSGRRVAGLHYALGKNAVLALPDYLNDTSRFTAETLLEELGQIGVPLSHSNFYRNHDFDPVSRVEQTEELRQRLLASLLLAGSIMAHEVRGRVARYDIDATALASRLEHDFETVELTAPFVRAKNSEDYRSTNGDWKPPVKEIKGVSVELEAWERDIDDFDKVLVEHALGVNAPF